MALTIVDPGVGGTGTTSFPSPGTNGNVLTSNGTAWTSAAASGGFDAGTRLIFAQTSAPTGWTKDTTNYNNHALRVVTGAASTGGSVDFTTAFAASRTSDATTLTTSQIPSHTHSYTGVSAISGITGSEGSVYPPSSQTTGATGGGGSHTHGLPSFAVKYLDVITATKN